MGFRDRWAWIQTFSFSIKVWPWAYPLNFLRLSFPFYKIWVLTQCYRVLLRIRNVHTIPSALHGSCTSKLDTPFSFCSTSHNTESANWAVQSENSPGPQEAVGVEKVICHPRAGLQLRQEMWVDCFYQGRSTCVGRIGALVPWAAGSGLKGPQYLISFPRSFQDTRLLPESCSYHVFSSLLCVFPNYSFTSPSPLIPLLNPNDSSAQ